MGGKCGGEMVTRVWWKNLQERNSLEVVVKVDSRIILKKSYGVKISR
jgi:hypothetical protein